jgi:hypothetical protein
MAEQGSSFSELASGLTSAEYLATSLTFGTTYEYKVEARNSYGYSAYSSTTSLLCAYIPDPPATVTTTNTNDQVTVSWSDPVANGQAIHAYRFYVLQSDGVTYTEETTDCDGTNASVVSNRQCTIALLTLKSSPYSLNSGDSVSVKVVSVNIYGESVESSAGNGAVIQLVPDSPVNLANDATTTTDTLIKFTWDDGSSNGGTSVLDYDIYYDQGSLVATYVILEEAVVNKFYQTTVSLIAGETYSFKVTARNTVGDSAMSAIVSILAAKAPDAPVSLANVSG